MLKPLIYIILSSVLTSGLFTVSCKQNAGRPVSQEKIFHEGDSVPAFVMTPDSIMIPYDSVKWDEPLDYVAFSEYDTLFADTFQLKNNYQLILFPSPDGYTGNHRIHYGHYARLIGDGIDSIITNSFGTEPSKYWLIYDSIDFEDSFAIQYSGGGNFALYIELFEKKTGKQLICAHSGSYDIENGLILYLDEETDREDKEGMKEVDSGVIIYDVRKKEKIRFNTPYNPCFGGMGFWTCYTITKVTPSTIYLRYDCCDKQVTIKVKR